MLERALALTAPDTAEAVETEAGVRGTAVVRRGGVTAAPPPGVPRSTDSPAVVGAGLAWEGEGDEDMPSSDAPAPRSDVPAARGGADGGSGTNPPAALWTLEPAVPGAPLGLPTGDGEVDGPKRGPRTGARIPRDGPVTGLPPRHVGEEPERKALIPPAMTDDGDGSGWGGLGLTAEGPGGRELGRPRLDGLTRMPAPAGGAAISPAPPPPPPLAPGRAAGGDDRELGADGKADETAETGESWPGVLIPAPHERFRPLHALTWTPDVLAAMTDVSAAMPGGGASPRAPSAGGSETCEPTRDAEWTRDDTDGHNPVPAAPLGPLGMASGLPPALTTLVDGEYPTEWAPVPSRGLPEGAKETGRDGKWSCHWRALARDRSCGCIPDVDAFS